MTDPLLTTLLDLDQALSWDQRLILGGGYGLLLKQAYLEEHPEIRTIVPLDHMPPVRTTKDIDLILRAEIVTDSTSMKVLRGALDRLGFVVVESARFTQFVRPVRVGEVKIDLLAAPLGEYASRVPKDRRRVKPRPRVDLHASKLEEALAVDRHALPVRVRGQLSSGESYETVVLVPQAFSYLLMKLFAFRDRVEDEDKELGRHHAFDVYRILGLMTELEDESVRLLADEYAGHPVWQEARRIAAVHFLPTDGLGKLRILEHPLRRPGADLTTFTAELRRLLAL